MATIDPQYDLSNICIRNLSMSKSPDSTITINIVTLPDEISISYNTIYYFYGYAVELKSMKISPTTKSLSFVSKNTDGNSLKVTKSVTFKTIPRSIYNIYESVMVPKAIMPPLFEPDMDIRILLCEDNYGIEGWRASAIFDALGLRVFLPAILDYRIFELSIKEGTPMLSMLQGLFPFPGVSINYFAGAYYVNINSDTFDADLLRTCEMLSRSVDRKVYETTITGLNSEPREVVNSVGTNGDMRMTLTGVRSQVILQTNLVGGIHGTLFEMESDISKSSYIDSMFNTYV